MSTDISNSIAPIVLFVYKRPIHTLKTLKSLKNNILAKESTLYVYCDGGKKDISKEDLKLLDETRRIVASEKWCRDVQIIEHDRNLGLAKSIVKGVSEVLDKHERVIVLEDDLILSTGFLEYMNKALTLYVEDEEVCSVSGYFFPINEQFTDTFFLKIITTWGWGTWKRAWNDYNHDLNSLKNTIKSKEEMYRFNVDNSYNYYAQYLKNLNGNSETWGIRWYMSNFKNQKLTLFPNKTLIQNIGHDDSGENCSSESSFNTSQLADSIKVDRIQVAESISSRKFLVDYFNEISGGVNVNRGFIYYLRRLKNIVLKLLCK